MILYHNILSCLQKSGFPCVVRLNALLKEKAFKYNRDLKQAFNMLKIL